MRQTSKTRRTIGIRGQLMGFLCFICFLLVGLFWFLSTQLLEPLYTTHIQKQLTEQAEAIVARMDEAIERGETLSYCCLLYTSLFLWKNYNVSSPGSWFHRR